MANKPYESEQDETADGRRVVTTERKGVVTETTYDAEGNLISVVKRIKGKGVDPRAGGPEANVEQRPL